MGRLSTNLLIALIFVVALGAVGWWTAVLRQDRSDESVMSASDIVAKTTLTGSYLSGRLARSQGDVRKTALYLAQALEVDPDNKELLAQTVKAKILAGDMDGAMVLAKRIRNTPNIQADFTRLLQALADIRQKNYKAARAALKEGGQDDLNSVLVPLITAWLDVGEGKVKQPITLKEAVRRMEPFAPFMYYQLALINDLAGYDKEAESYYKRAIGEAAKMPYRVVEALGNFYERKGKLDQANALYERYREMTPDSALFDVTVRTARAPSDRIITSASDGVAELFFSVASIFYTEDSMEETLVHVRMALYLRPDFPPAQLMLGNALEQMKDYDGALEAYASINRHSPFYLKGRLRAASVYDLQEDTGRALKELDAIASEYPDRYDAYMTKGDIFRRHDRYREAADAYSQAVERVPSLRPYHWALLYARGIAYERSDQWDLAEKDFLKALELEPGQPDVLNYLGYSWLVMGKKITEARTMIEQAIAKRPGDAHIIDSMGWALYSQGDYDGALRYLERAAGLAPDDATVNDHLGDVYWRLGRITEARYQWEKALIFKPDEKDVVVIRKKLAEGLPPVKPVSATKVGAAEDRRNAATAKQ